jgi:hypothetical protein
MGKLANKSGLLIISNLIVGILTLYHTFFSLITSNWSSSILESTAIVLVGMWLIVSNFTSIEFCDSEMQFFDTNLGKAFVYIVCSAFVKNDGFKFAILTIVLLTLYGARNSGIKGYRLIMAGLAKPHTAWVRSDYF